MQKKHSTIEKRIPPCRLYKDDLEEICRVIDESCESYKIAIGEYEVNKYIEISELPMLVSSDITISTNNPNVIVSLSGSYAKISSYNDDTINAGIVAKIEEIINKRTFPSLKFINLYYFLIWIVIDWIIPIFDNQINIMLWTPIWCVFYLISLALNFKYKFIKHSKIYLTYKKDNPNIIKRNKDKIIFTVIGIILEFLREKFFK
jgi:hypothetical protein